VRLAIALLLLGSCAFGAELRVENGQQLLAAAKSAKPGDEIILADGNWTDQHLKLTLTGTQKAPILLRAETMGKAVFSGESSLEIIANHVVVDGLVFKGGALDGGHVLRIRGENCRVTRCSILDYNPKKSATRYHWLSLHGRGHRVDHCRFSGQNHSGTTLVVWLDGENPGNHRIDHNHFGPRPRGDGNGFETLRIGDSQTSMIDANCFVTANLFESCDGEIEIVSNKSCQNTYFGNTFDRCSGCLTLRHGNRCVVAFNWILGGGKKGTGGIRVVGEGHRIFNNHIEGTDARSDAAIALSSAVPDAKLNEHALVRDVEIDSNIIQNNRGEAFTFAHGLGSHGRILPAENIEPTNNQIDGEGPEIQMGHRLTPYDVGPESRLDPHPDAIANSHPSGEVDKLELTAFIVPNPRSLTGIVIDETEAELVGDWQYSTHTPPHIGIGYLHDGKSGKGEKSVTYRFDPPQSGLYEVQLSHCYNVRRSTNTPVTIHHADGEETIRINQQDELEIDRLFRSLGQFRFETSKPAWIRISTDGTDGKYVIADSIRLIPVEPAQN
jgi:poly(beta-D-mannuronate) lyase